MNRQLAYAAVLSCDHVNWLRPNWNATVESPELGPYEGFCNHCLQIQKIVRFIPYLPDSEVEPKTPPPGFDAESALPADSDEQSDREWSERGATAEERSNT